MHIRSPLAEMHMNLCDKGQWRAGAAYHTCADVPERLAAGSLQLRGDTLLATLAEFSAVVAARLAPPGPLPAREAEGSAYFDVFARFMVVYPMWLARLLHHAPLPAALAAALAGVTAKPCKTLNNRAWSAGVRAALGGLAVWAAAVGAGVALPAAVGAMRAWASGRPLAWFGSLPLALGIYAPAAFAGLLAPYALLPSVRAGPEYPDPSYRAHLLGAALAHAAAASAATAAGAKSGFIPGLWALGALAAAVFAGAPGLHRTAAALAACAPALVAAAPVATVLPMFVLEHISILVGPCVPATPCMGLSMSSFSSRSYAGRSTSTWQHPGSKHTQIRCSRAVIPATCVLDAGKTGVLLDSAGVRARSKSFFLSSADVIAGQ